MLDHDFDARIPGKPLSHSLQHRRRKIDSHGFGVRMCLHDHRQQSPVARAQIEYPTRATRGINSKQCRLTFGTMRDLVGAFQIVAGMFSESTD